MGPVHALGYAAAVVGPARRRALGAIAAFAGLGLIMTACQSTSPYAATVNGARVGQDQLLRELRAIAANKSFVTGYDSSVDQANAQAAQQGQAANRSPVLASGNASQTFTQGFTAVVLNTDIQAALIHAEVVRRRIQPSPAAVTGAKGTAAQEFGQDPSVFNGFSSWFQHLYEVRAAEQDALAKALGPVDASTVGIRNFYDANPQDFITTECVSHILVGNKQLAATIRTKIEAGADFAGQAKKYSTDKGSAVKGGALGCAAPGQYVAPFEHVADTIRVGQLSQPVQSQFGWHLIKVTSRQLQPLDAQTSQAILQQLQQESPITAFLQRIQKSLKVTVNPAYGSWDPAQGVVPPVGPSGNSGISTTTTQAPAQTPAAQTPAAQTPAAQTPATQPPAAQPPATQVTPPSSTP
jgi:foldase protein PrsA